MVSDEDPNPRSGREPPKINPGDPLPKIGEPYMKAWGDMYDFYGMQVTGKRAGDNYNSSVDSLFRMWEIFIDFDSGFITSFAERRYGKKKYYTLDETRTHLFPMTKYSNAINIFNKLYGGFGFDAMMRMLVSDPDVLRREMDYAFNEWMHETFDILLRDFCIRQGIITTEIPLNTWGAMKEWFYRICRGARVEDFGDYMKYKIGMELEDGTYIEITAYKLYMDWTMGQAIKQLAGAIVGLRHGIETTVETGRVPGRISRWLFGKKIAAAQRRQFGWTMIHKGKRFNIMDVVRFYPLVDQVIDEGEILLGMGGEPVQNPLRKRLGWI